MILIEPLIFILRQVVREQCWLNEVLLGCHWTPEGLNSEEDIVDDSTVATEEELEAVLAGTSCTKFTK